MTNLNALVSGTELAGDFRIDRVLGAGGFGVTYLAHEIGLNRRVTIKEYFPIDFAARDAGGLAGPRSQASAKDYTWGLERFIEEAQVLARFDHPHIVRVYRTFKANNTAYMVLQFEEGQNLKAWLSSLGRAPRQKELDGIVAPLLDALETIHKCDFLHRDIAPDNIMIRKSGEPVLIDFGAARGDIAAHSKTKTVSALVKPGYSPYEQYAETSRQQGPWTDIYALSATLYHAVAGKRPPDSPSRMLNDEIVPAREAALSSYRSTFLDAIDRGLALAIDQRPQSVAAWRGALLAPEPKKPGILARMRDQSEAATPAKRKTARAGSGDLAVISAIPPPPDAPGPAGGLLDFVDGLRAPAPPPAGRATKAAAPAAAKSPTAKVAAKSPAQTQKAAGAVAVKPDAPRARRRPRPAPDVARKRLKRGLAARVAIACSIFAGIVVFKDELPRLLAKPETSQITTGALSTAPAHTQLVPGLSFKTGESAVESVQLSGDGLLVVTMGRDKVLKIWNRGDGTPRGSIFMDDGPATSLDVRNNRALTAHADGSVNIWDLDRQQRLYRFKRNEARVWSAIFTGSEDRIATAAHDWTVSLWQTGLESAPTRVLEGHANAVQALAADRSGAWLASGGADKMVKLWNLETNELKRTLRNNTDYVTALAFSPDAGVVAAGGLDGSIRLWERSSGRVLRTHRTHASRITSVAFSADGRLIASASDDGAVRVRGVGRSRPYWTLNGLEGGARSLTFAADGRQLLTGGQDGIVTIWSLPERPIAQR